MSVSIIIIQFEANSELDLGHGNASDDTKLKFKVIIIHDFNQL